PSLESVISYQLSVISYQLSDVSFQFTDYRLLLTVHSKKLPNPSLITDYCTLISREAQLFVGWVSGSVT
ncbi:MAG: hypothetical protein ACKPKE_26730, partial [Microcystis panniformis]